MAGVPIQLAQRRAERISGVQYELSLSIPASSDEPITGRGILSFILDNADEPILIDFQNSPDHVVSIEANQTPCEVEIARGQIRIAQPFLRLGQNSIVIEFIAGDGALNRRENMMYSLFVPDRASSAFPCFDQPDLKVRFTLSLEIPAAWTAVSNGSELNEVSQGDRKTVQFAPTRPISTYLFAFATGEFQKEEIKQSGFEMRIFHRETDESKLAANLSAIFELHQTSLKWMENYTGISYPFGKFDSVLIPAFQFGGMEHPGAIFYRDTRLLLEDSATLSEKLGRASLIAHETAHMWFGDLVTMKWFDDVWLKEVFAGFMASKIVNPAFPEIDHNLRFLLDHYPAAHSVERSEGTHPIRQQLDNLNDSASLYGALIYHKAPILMRQLELLTGHEVFRSGLQDYLRSFEFGNADWLDLIKILDPRTTQDLKQWGQYWVEESGRPTIWIDSSSTQGQLHLRQVDPFGKGRLWPQKVTVLLSRPQGSLCVPVDLVRSTHELPGYADLDFVLPNIGNSFQLLKGPPYQKSSKAFFGKA